MPARTVSRRMSPSRSIRRRKSPSVNRPSARPWSSRTIVMPIPLRDISSSACDIVASIPTTGRAAPLRITSETRVKSFRPSAPPGCERAKSAGPKPRACRQATASASPIAREAVVLEVGARFSGQASSVTLTSKWTSASRASSESGLPVRAMALTPSRCAAGRIERISWPLPEYDSATKRS